MGAAVAQTVGTKPAAPPEAAAPPPASAPTAPASANPKARADEQARLAACIARIETEPEEAYEDGLAWLSEGGRPAARHCTALALVAIGQEAEGASRLGALAAAADGGPLEARALYLAQAANAWMLAGDPEAALTALAAGLKLAPRDAQLHKDRARALLLLDRWDEAGAALDRALEFAPADAEVLRLRAEALLALGRHAEALADVEAALELAPRDVDLLVLRGRAREAIRLAGG